MYVVPLLVVLKMTNNESYNQFVEGKNATPLVDLLENIQMRNDWSYSEFLSRDEYYDTNQPSGSRTKCVTFKQKIRLLLKLLASYRGSDDYIVLDFFSGSATTAHATIKLNAQDGGKRKFIIYYNILQYSLLQKDKAFAYEQEYRIALPFESEYLDDSCSREFIISETLIKPQTEFKNFPISEILEEVIISPFVKSELTHMGVQELLKANGISPDIVLKSNILIR